MLANPNATLEALTSWIRDYFAENGPTAHAVVGISGGKDSSVVAALCVRALGANRVVGVLMPNGEQADIEDARTVVAHLGIRSICVDISGATAALSSALIGAEGFAEAAGDNAGLSRDTRINLPARIRMTTLYAVAQSLPHGARVANTCNRSEDYVGYSTKYGDAAGDFSPLANILVEEVRQLGSALGLPEHLVQKTPSDGLSGQSDEDKLGFTYATLDHYITTGECDDAATRERIDALHTMNLHKLKPMPAFQL